MGGESAWRAEQQLLNAYRLARAVVAISPLNALTELISNGISNDVWRPNKARERVKTYRLPDATTMLTRTGDLEWILNPPDDRTTADRADYIAWWRDRLAERGIHMYVVLVPAKLSVYGPLLGEAVPASPHYLDRLEGKLESRGINVVNGRSVLSPYAAGDLASGRLAYLREDQHWNALGVRRIAAAIARKLQASGEGTTSPDPGKTPKLQPKSVN